ncbi:DNA-3-methyladenine glycosylase family protein [Halobacillus litoralis]|uniref:DNA-3-methyladenine glycosylase family protein n=1 Tax=Halobacillus litoralis TaxID=45668 RepID=UPI001CFCDA8C|nr:DNA-3-methyladenine glycosylase [Halobacillus litoralis]
MWTEQFKTATFYDFDYTLLRWQFDPLTRLDRKERWVDVPVKLGSNHHIVRVQGHGTTESPLFSVSSDSQEDKEALVAHISDLFQWDADLESVHHHFLGTSLESIFTAHPGTPIVKDFHLYDCLMKVIIHQQLNMKFAYTLSTRFVEKLGTKKDGVWFYPSPEEVADTSYDVLRELQFSQRKAEYVIDTSRLIAEGSLNLKEISSESNDNIMKRLVKVRGIGPWTAENWMMFGVGRENLFPVADIGIQNALKAHFELEKKPTVEQMKAWSTEWEPYLSYASLNLWRSIEG